MAIIWNDERKKAAKKWIDCAFISNITILLSAHPLICMQSSYIRESGVGTLTPTILMAFAFLRIEMWSRVPQKTVCEISLEHFKGAGNQYRHKWKLYDSSGKEKLFSQSERERKMKIKWYIPFSVYASTFLMENVKTEIWKVQKFPFALFYLIFC